MKYDSSVIDELSSLYWLNREIEEQKSRLAELESLALYNSDGNDINKGIHSGKKVDTTAQHACELADLKAIIQANLDKILPERRRLERFINQIPAPDARIIFRLRHINCMPWEQIGAELGYTESGVRKKYRRYIKKLSENSD